MTVSQGLPKLDLLGWESIMVAESLSGGRRGSTSKAVDIKGGTDLCARIDHSPWADVGHKRMLCVDGRQTLSLSCRGLTVLYTLCSSVVLACSAMHNI